MRLRARADGRRRASSTRPRVARSRNGVTQSRVVNVPSTSNAATMGRAAGGVSGSAERGYTLDSVSDGPGDLRRPLPRPAGRRRAAKAAARGGADERGGRGSRPLAADVGVAQGPRRRGIRDRNVRSRASRSAASCSAAGAAPRRSPSSRPRATLRKGRARTELRVARSDRTRAGKGPLLSTVEIGGGAKPPVVLSVS